MGVDLSRVGERERLKAQREPHWQRLRAGCFLGFDHQAGRQGNLDCSLL
jgi:hypothetical protein